MSYKKTIDNNTTRQKEVDEIVMLEEGEEEGDIFVFYGHLWYQLPQSDLVFHFI